MRVDSVGSNRIMVALPEVIEVEPVVRRAACMVLQPAGITLHQFSQHRAALRPRHLDAFAEHLECKIRSEEHTSELQSLMRISYAVFCLKQKKKHIHTQY